MDSKVALDRVNISCQINYYEKNIINMAAQIFKGATYKAVICL